MNVTHPALALLAAVCLVACEASPPEPTAHSAQPASTRPQEIPFPPDGWRRLEATEFAAYRTSFWRALADVGTIYVTPSFADAPSFAAYKKWLDEKVKHGDPTNIDAFHASVRAAITAKKQHGRNRDWPPISTQEIDAALESFSLVLIGLTGPELMEKGALPAADVAALGAAIEDLETLLNHKLASRGMRIASMQPSSKSVHYVIIDGEEHCVYSATVYDTDASRDWRAEHEDQVGDVAAADLVINLIIGKGP